MALQDLKDQAVKGLDDAFALGAASVVVVGDDPTPFSQADLDAAVLKAKDELKVSVKALLQSEEADLEQKLALL